MAWQVVGKNPDGSLLLRDTETGQTANYTPNQGSNGKSETTIGLGKGVAQKVVNGSGTGASNSVSTGVGLGTGIDAGVGYGSNVAGLSSNALGTGTLGVETSLTPTLDAATAGASGASAAGTATGGAASSTPGGGAAGYISSGMDVYNSIKNWKNVPKDQKATKAQQDIALTVADWYTGGLAGMAEGFARSHWGGTMSKLDKLDQKTNPMSIMLNKTLFRKTTKDVQKENTAKLAAMDPTNQDWQTTLQGYRGEDWKHSGNPDMPYDGGKYANWEDYVKGGLDAKDLTGVNGMLQTYGPDYAKLSFDQKVALTQKAIDTGQFNSKKGEVNVNDPEALKASTADMLAGFLSGKQATPTSPAKPTTGGDAIASLTNPGKGVGGLGQVGNGNASSVDPGIFLDPNSDYAKQMKSASYAQRKADRAPGIQALINSSVAQGQSGTNNNSMSSVLAMFGKR